MIFKLAVASSTDDQRRNVDGNDVLRNFFPILTSVRKMSDDGGRRKKYYRQTNSVFGYFFDFMLLTSIFSRRRKWSSPLLLLIEGYEPRCRKVTFQRGWLLYFFELQWVLLYILFSDYRPHPLSTILQKKTRKFFCYYKVCSFLASGCLDIKILLWNFALNLKVPWRRYLKPNQNGSALNHFRFFAHL